MTETTFDPFDAAQVQDAWPVLRTLRRDGPVARIGPGMYYVTRFAEAREVLKDFHSFSNAAGFRAPGVEIPPEDRMLGEQDPPQHPFVRRVVVAAFSAATVRREEPFIRDTARSLLAAIRSGTSDLVPALTVPLPNIVTVHFMGFPIEDAERIAEWSEEVMHSEWPATNRTERGEGFDGAFPEFAGYINAFIARTRARLADGDTVDNLVSRLMQVEVDGNRLGDRQLLMLTQNLLIGGLTTTSQLLGNLLHRLMTDSAIEQLLRTQAGEVPAVVEESLRLTPPVLFIPRGCVQPVSVGGTSIMPGERVIVGVASANRDEQVFDDSEQFDADRSNNDRNLSFGHGTHLCVGASLARAVARVGVEEFLARFAPGTVDLVPGFRFENVSTYFECGPRTLPVVVGQ